jgi:hypothetical protein
MNSATYGRHTLRTVSTGHAGRREHHDALAARLRAQAAPAALAAAVIASLAALVPGVALAQATVPPPTVVVTGGGPGNTAVPIASYRWTLEEDTTKASTPGEPARLGNLSYGFHTSYMPVIAADRVQDGQQVTDRHPNDTDPDRAYQLFPRVRPGP